jgi:hypothetical protein
MGSVEDRVDIQELLVRYGYLLDTFQFERIAPEIFTEDATLDYGTGEIVGREGISAFFEQFRGGLDGISHMITNFIVEVNGDTARSLSRNTGWHWHSFLGPRGSLRTADMVLIGGYDDELRREGDGWRIASRWTFPLGSGIGIGDPPEFMRPLLEGLVGRQQRWKP